LFDASVLERFFIKEKFMTLLDWSRAGR